MSCSDARSDEVAAAVYYNDLIMSMILNNVICLMTRRNVELASLRLYHLSKRSGWALTTPFQKTLAICGYQKEWFFSRVTIDLGSFHIERKSAVHEVHGSTVLNIDLMNRLNKICSTLGNYINHVQISGSTMKEEKAIIVTRDIFIYLNRLKNLKTLSFENCFIENDAVEYIQSPQCILKDRVSSLILSQISFEEDWCVPQFAEIIGKNLKKLKLRMCENFEVVVLDKMNERNIMLEKLSLTLTNAGRMTEAVVTALDKKCVAFEMSLEDGYSQRVNPELEELALRCHLLQNLSVLKLKMKSLEMVYTNIFFNFVRMEKLVHLSVDSWKPETSMAPLIDAVAQMKNLKGFEFQWKLQRMGSRSVEELITPKVEELMTKMSGKIERMCLGNIPLTENSLKIMINKYSKSLRVLKIKSPKGCKAEKIFKTILRSFENLTVFHFDQVIPAEFLLKVLERKSIQEAVVVLERTVPLFYTVLFNDNFLRHSEEEFLSECKMLRLEQRKDDASIRIPSDPKEVRRIHRQPRNN